MWAVMPGRVFEFCHTVFQAKHQPFLGFVDFLLLCSQFFLKSLHLCGVILRSSVLSHRNPPFQFSYVDFIYAGRSLSIPRAPVSQAHILVLFGDRHILHRQ